MAIDIGIETQYGSSFEYHKIVDVHLIVKQQVQMRITVDSWLNKQCRIEGKKPVRTVNIIDGIDFALTPFYQLLKMKFPQYNAGADDFDDSWKVEPEKADIAYTVQSETSVIGHWKEAAAGSGGSEETEEGSAGEMTEDQQEAEDETGIEVIGE